MKRIVVALTLTLSLPYWTLAQVKGIKFLEFSNWEQVITEAKQEDKNIFIHAFATWCGPCKMMDSDVFSDKRLGDFVNSKYIPIRLQIDETSKDNITTKAWRNFSKDLAKTYCVDVFPTFLLVSKQGELLERATGFHSVGELFKLLEHANNPKSNFVGIMKRLDENSLSSDSLFQLAIDLKEKKQDSLAYQVAKLYKAAFIDRNVPEKILSPQLKEVLFRFHQLFSNEDSVVRFLYNYPEASDSKMKSTYARNFIEYIINRDYINPQIMSGGKFNAEDPDWEFLEKRIAKDFDYTIAHKMIVLNQANYYSYFHVWQKAVRYIIESIEIKGIDMDLIEATRLNNLLYEIVFTHGYEKKQLLKAIGFMEELLKSDNSNYYWIDTYANLLYKVGKKSEAIVQQNRAILLAKDKNDLLVEANLRRKLALMKNDSPTWTSTSH